MKLRRWAHEGNHPAYLLGDEATSIGLVIDPPQNPGPILDEAGRLGLSIEHVFFTGDVDGAFPSMLPFLERGAHIYRSARSIPRADITPLLPGCSITIGRIRLQALQHDARRVAYHIYEVGADGSKVLALTVAPTDPPVSEPGGECDGYPRSSFLHSFSRW